MWWDREHAGSTKVDDIEYTWGYDMVPSESCCGVDVLTRLRVQNSNGEVPDGWWEDDDYDENDGLIEMPKTLSRKAKKAILTDVAEHVASYRTTGVLAGYDVDPKKIKNREQAEYGYGELYHEDINVFTFFKFLGIRGSEGGVNSSQNTVHAFAIPFKRIKDKIPK